MSGQLAISNGQLAMDYRLAIGDFAAGFRLSGSRIEPGMTGGAV